MMLMTSNCIFVILLLEIIFSKLIKTPSFFTFPAACHHLSILSSVLVVYLRLLLLHMVKTKKMLSNLLCSETPEWRLILKTIIHCLLFSTSFCAFLSFLNNFPFIDVFRNHPTCPVNSMKALSNLIYPDGLMVQLYCSCSVPASTFLRRPC